MLEQTHTNNKIGRGNLALIALLYDSGARVQKLIDLSPSSLNLNKPYCITLFGKGNKKRIVPLQEEQIKLLEAYMAENNLNKSAFNQQPLFANSSLQTEPHSVRPGQYIGFISFTPTAN